MANEFACRVEKVTKQGARGKETLRFGGGGDDGGIGDFFFKKVTTIAKT